MAINQDPDWIGSRSNGYWEREQSRVGRVVNDVVGAVDNAVVLAGAALTFSRAQVEQAREGIRDFREAKHEWRDASSVQEWLAVQERLDTTRYVSEAVPDRSGTDQPSVSKALQAHMRDVKSYSEMLAQRQIEIEAEQPTGLRQAVDLER